MGRFVDIAPPENIRGYPCVSSPITSTTMQSAASGKENANQNWEQPLHRFRLVAAIRCQETYNGLLDHWHVMAGPFRLWPFKDPMDFASVPLLEADQTPPISGTDQFIAVCDGVETEFQLIKTYTRGILSSVRTIELPVVDSVIPTLDGLNPLLHPDGPFAWSVSREGGRISFTAPPTAGLELRSGYLFDVPVRFETDSSLEGVVHAMRLSGQSDLVLLEKGLC